ncbi:hypothetical protein Ocin01_17101 [Orchesella cincta]|uniref:Uncharacterized protein n=1 Tax=Orchesella cincta TaxID=48709 RepID=A0A1D2M9D0_ORCCI|nr:hypothetical protein Ocin01_17101 [Orchesella cincta]
MEGLNKEGDDGMADQTDMEVMKLTSRIHYDSFHYDSSPSQSPILATPSPISSPSLSPITATPSPSSSPSLSPITATPSPPTSPTTSLGTRLKLVAKRRLTDAKKI